MADYALIGDCHAAALVSRHGSIDWLCLPRFSSDSVFAALLDAQCGGRWSISPCEPYVATQTYVPQSNVLQTRFECASGVAVLTDALAIPDHADGQLHPEREILRMVECVSGRVSLRFHFSPRARFGRTPLSLRRLGHLGWQCRHRGMDSVLQTDFVVQRQRAEDCLVGERALHRGEIVVSSWAYADREVCAVPAFQRAQDRMDASVRWWRDWQATYSYRGPHAPAIQRSLLTLKLLTSALTGAVLAAPTTSLPECIGGSRNWDYRYCWIRDSAFAMRAFLELGCESEAAAFQHWLLRAVRLPWGRLQVVYDQFGDTHLPERTLKHLRGYRDSRPVRIGNAASRQFQADLYGELIATTADYVGRGGVLSDDEQRLLRDLAPRICQRWRRPDQGIWESRGATQHHTFSKAMCWVALERLIEIDQHLDLGIDIDRLRTEQESIRNQIETQGFDTRLNAYVSHYGAQHTDASLLLLARYGYVAATHPRMRGTFELIERELTEGAHVWRYRSADGIQGREHSFLPCGFWAVEYLALAGRCEEAEQRLATLLTCSSPAGLFSEEFDPAAGLLTGNYPQALTHESLISAVLTLQANRP